MRFSNCYSVQYLKKRLQTCWIFEYGSHTLKLEYFIAKWFCKIIKMIKNQIKQAIKSKYL